MWPHSLLREEKVRGRMKKFRESLLKRRKQREVDEKMGQTRQSRLEDFFSCDTEEKGQILITKFCKLIARLNIVTKNLVFLI